MSKTIFKSKKTRIALRVVVLALVGIILGVSIYTWNAKNLVGDQLPMPLGIGAAVILSGSMEPLLSVDDLVIIRKADDLAVDDVVVYQSGHSLVIHRIIAIDGDTVTTQGDANNTADAPISRDDIKGTLVASIPGVGRLLDIIRHPIVVILIIALALFMLERSYRQEKAQDTAELDEIKKEIRELLDDLKEP